MALTFLSYGQHSMTMQGCTLALSALLASLQSFQNCVCTLLRPIPVSQFTMSISVLKNLRWLNTLNRARWCVGSSAFSPDSQAIASCSGHGDCFLVFQKPGYHLSSLKSCSAQISLLNAPELCLLLTGPRQKAASAVSGTCLVTDCQL